MANGYNKKPSFNYEEAFLPIVMLKSIKVLLSLVAHLNYEIWKMDVKILFLNRNLNECIYMMQLDDCIAKNQEHMAYKFHKSIYGLKQASHLLLKLKWALSHPNIWP